MLIGWAFISISVYVSLSLGVTAFLMLPPMYACFLSFSSPRWVSLGAALLSGLTLTLFMDPLHALLYTLAGGVFGIVAYSLSHVMERVELLVVLMGSYLSMLYMLYIIAARELLGVDLHAGVKTALVEMFGKELTSMGINITELFRQIAALSFGGIFMIGGVLALWSLYMGARLAASRGTPVRVPNFLAFRLRELTLLPIAALYAVLYLLSVSVGGDFWQMASVLTFILLFLFFLQGISFIAWWRAKRGKNNRLFYLLAFLLFLIPMGQIGMGLLGFIENMTQMRKIGG